MTSLPTAHASQRFGAREIDFYAAPGMVVGSDPRARFDERRIQDNDGARHTVRLSDKAFTLEPGDPACVLRLQPGPSRRSRPVAVINYDTGRWSRTHPRGHALLARIGVARGMNWALSAALILAAMLTILYPALVGLLSGVAPQLAGALPRFDVFALAASAIPALGQLDTASLLGGSPAALTALVPALEGQAVLVILAAATLAGGVFTFWSRSWRLLWIPALVGSIGVASMGLAGSAAAALPALTLLGVVLGIFVIGGALNRWRDAARFESRIARLCDHLLRQRPEEAVGEARPSAVERESTVDPEDVAADAHDVIEAQDERAIAASGDAPEDDPRRARDIALPPPPPMPAAQALREPGDVSDEAEAAPANEAANELESDNAAAEPEAEVQSEDASMPSSAETGDDGMGEASESEPADPLATSESSEDTPSPSESSSSEIEAEPVADEPLEVAAPVSGPDDDVSPSHDAGLSPRASIAPTAPALGAPPAWSAALLPDNVVPIFSAPAPEAPPAPPTPGEGSSDDDTAR
ncbi:MAG: hypothetical protein AAFX09_11865 [Pseudomonadota bacterium]